MKQARHLDVVKAYSSPQQVTMRYTILCTKNGLKLTTFALCLLIFILRKGLVHIVVLNFAHKCLVVETSAQAPLGVHGLSPRLRTEIYQKNGVYFVKLFVQSHETCIVLGPDFQISTADF